MITVDARQLSLVGDSLAAVPYIRFLAERNGFGAWFPHDTFDKSFCWYVRPLLDPTLGFLFGKDNAPCATPRSIFVDLHKAFHYAHHVDRSLHMAQTHFVVNGYEAPPLPISIPLRAAMFEPQRDTIVVAPFSRSDHNNQKAWFPDRWVDVIGALLTSDLGITRAIILGNSRYDNPEPYLGPKTLPMMDQPLSIVLGVMRACRLFLSVDNGLGHLAHYGGVRHHAMLQPACLSTEWVRNPLGRMIQGDPRTVPAAAMIGLAMEMLTK